VKLHGVRLEHPTSKGGAEVHEATVGRWNTTTSFEVAKEEKYMDFTSRTNHLLWIPSWQL
jgi:hypothetical protein